MSDSVDVQGPWVLSSVSLTIEKPDLDPGTVTAVLGIEPTATRVPGPSRWRPAEDTNGLWMMECDQRTAKDPDEQLAHVLALTDPKSAELAALQQSGHEISLEVRGYAGDGAMFAIPHALLVRIAHLGIPLKVVPNINER
ncbi:DUF4279 domain-containing protein [Streptomyces rectiverticillatus]|uniref:DUF4279 domain-containing protein n=1 Tax=Streptomyces rectiverticillatus TaxID=173860 RepID=UPI0015C338A1|nr:DUF4279 domain-containing protein [Streptomyces rectiverticillatus]